MRLCPVRSYLRDVGDSAAISAGLSVLSGVIMGAPGVLSCARLVFAFGRWLSVWCEWTSYVAVEASSEQFDSIGRHLNVVDLHSNSDPKVRTKLLQVPRLSFVSTPQLSSTFYANFHLLRAYYG